MDFKTFLSPSFFYGCLVTALILFSGHWFPWNQWLGRDLPRLACYVYGVLAIMIGFSIWVADWTLALGLFLVCAAGGLAVISAYVLDWLGLDRAKARRGDRVLGNDASQR